MMVCCFRGLCYLKGFIVDKQDKSSSPFSDVFTKSLGIKLFYSEKAKKKAYLGNFKQNTRLLKSIMPVTRVCYIAV